MTELLFCDDDKQKMHPAVVCNDVPGLFQKVLEEHGHQGASPVLKLGADRGQGSLKICIAIYSSHHSNATQSPSKAPSRKKPSLHEETDMRKLLLLGNVSDVVENYGNLKVFLESINFGHIRCIWTVDLKMAIILHLVFRHGQICAFSVRGQHHAVCLHKNEPWGESGS